MHALAFIPDWRDDETLYSWSAAFHVMCGMASARQTGKLLFDSEHACKERDAPRNLHHFVNLTDGKLGDVRTTVRRRTAVGQYIPFLPASRRALFEAQIDHSGGLGWRTLCGMAASGLDSAGALRYCEACIHDDLRIWGLPRWRISHQWLAVWICVEHSRPLRTVALKSSEWILPPLQRAPPAVSTESGNELLALIDISKLSKLLVSAEMLNMESARQISMNALREQGITSWARPIDRQLLARWFQGTALSSWLGRQQGPDLRMSTGEWIHDTLRDRRVDHPLKWLILWGALFQGEDACFTARRLQEPVLQPHWDASGQGQIWGTALENLPLDVMNVLASAPTLSDAARLLGTTPMSLRKRLRLSGTTPKFFRAEQSSEARLERSTADVQSYLRQHPGCKRTDVLRHCNTSCAWLKKNDPGTLESLLSRVPFEKGAQIPLFRPVLGVSPAPENSANPATA